MSHAGLVRSADGAESNGGTSHKFSCSSAPCIACWCCSAFGAIVVAVFVIVFATVYVPSLGRAAVAGSTMTTLEANLTTFGKKEYGQTLSYFSSVMKIVNPMPMGGELEAATMDLTCDEKFSSFTPTVLGHVDMPKLDMGPGTTVFTIKDAHFRNTLSTDGLKIGQWSFGLFVPIWNNTNCGSECTATKKMRPVVQKQTGEVHLKMGFFKAKATMEKLAVCHCIEGYPLYDLAWMYMCEKLDYRLPYSTKYTPCLNNSQCTTTGQGPGPTITHRTGYSVPGKNGIEGFHCAPADEILF